MNNLSQSLWQFRVCCYHNQPSYVFFVTTWLVRNLTKKLLCHLVISPCPQIFLISMIYSYSMRYGIQIHLNDIKYLHNNIYINLLHSAHTKILSSHHDQRLTHCKFPTLESGTDGAENRPRSRDFTPCVPLSPFWYELWKSVVFIEGISGVNEPGEGCRTAECGGVTVSGLLLSIKQLYHIWEETQYAVPSC
jgi:hypothetical protein